MQGAAKLALSALIGGALGLVTATRAIDTGIAGLAQSTGQWTTWPAAGRQDEDPYTRAHFLLEGRLPISSFEAREFQAERDAGGALLDGSCTYVLEGPLPPSRWWSLWAVPAGTQQNGITSQAALFERDGSLRATFSQAPQPGNWIRPSTAGPFRIVLRFYSPGAASRGPLRTPSLPTVRREAC